MKKVYILLSATILTLSFANCKPAAEDRVKMHENAKRVSDSIGKLPVFSWAVFLSLFMVLIITAMPTVHFSIVLIFFAIWFVLATGRAITAQAMISEVVKQEQRGSFMSINGSVQQLGSGIASLAAGAIVITDASGKIMRYNWVGYLSILVLIASLLLGRSIFKKLDKPAKGCFK